MVMVKYITHLCENKFSQLSDLVKKIKNKNLSYIIFIKKKKYYIYTAAGEDVTIFYHQKLSEYFKESSCFHWQCVFLHLNKCSDLYFSFFSLAVKVKLSKKRTLLGDQEYNIECQVEFITQGSLLPYETQNMIQQWLLINENCTQKMTQTHRPMVYLLVGKVEEGIILVNQVYRWQRRDSQLTLATQKWRYHKCL